MKDIVAGKEPKLADQQAQEALQLINRSLAPSGRRRKKAAERISRRARNSS